MDGDGMGRRHGTSLLADVCMWMCVVYGRVQVGGQKGSQVDERMDVCTGKGKGGRFCCFQPFIVLVSIHVRAATHISLFYSSSSSGSASHSSVAHRISLHCTACHSHPFPSHSHVVSCLFQGYNCNWLFPLSDLQVADMRIRDDHLLDPVPTIAGCWVLGLPNT